MAFLIETINYFINSAYTNFINSPCVNKLENGAKKPKKVYITCLKKYFEFPGAIKVIDNVNPDGKKVENHIIDFVISLKKQGKGFAAISNYVSTICKYYKMNDVVLDTNKIHQYLPEFRKAKKDRAYRYEEIHRLLVVADERCEPSYFY